MSIEIALRALEEKLEPLDRVIRLFAASLGEPTLRKNGDERGFRYEAPDVQHFCLLKAVRALSALNAAIELARKGYTQEIAVLMRTLIECTTHIEFVLEIDDTEEHRTVVRKYIEDFFFRWAPQPDYGDSEGTNPARQGARHARQEIG